MFQYIFASLPDTDRQRGEHERHPMAPKKTRIVTMCVVWLYTVYVVEVPSSKLSLDVLLSDNRGYFEVWDPPCTLGWSLTTCFFYFLLVLCQNIQN